MAIGYLFFESSWGWWNSLVSWGEVLESRLDIGISNVQESSPSWELSSGLHMHVVAWACLHTHAHTHKQNRNLKFWTYNLEVRGLRWRIGPLITLKTFRVISVYKRILVDERRNIALHKIFPYFLYSLIHHGTGKYKRFQLKIDYKWQ